MGVKHSTTVAVADDGVSPVGSAEWNASHVIDNDTITYAMVQNVSATDRLLGRDTAGVGDIEEITVGGGLEFTGAAGIQIANDGVSYARMQNISAASKLLGRGSAGGAGDPEEITIGSGLTMTGTTLSSSGGGGTPGGSSLTLQYNNA